MKFPLSGSFVSSASTGYAPQFMELTLEAYRNIVNYVGVRSDIATLCRVSQGFRHVAERALYNTVFLRNDEETNILCRTLTNSQRLAALVDALTILLSTDDDSSGSEDEDQPEHGRELPVTYWSSIAGALEKAVRLRYLNIHISDGSSTSTAWILKNCTFQLRRFHCDFNWDQDLVIFLNGQTALEDLYILDYDGFQNPLKSSETEPLHPPPILSRLSIPKLSVLECTFSEAAVALVPGRPITHLKTCFSRTELNSKRNEMYGLLAKIVLSTSPLHSLDLADSSYTEQFSTELLAAIADTRSLRIGLCYLGTLVLPIDGRERLRFYGYLRRFPKIQCLEFEVSEWHPPPSAPAALKALASELRLYIPSVTRVVFVHDFNRNVVTALDGICRVEAETSTDLLWREI